MFIDKPPQNKKLILVFYCEFSSQRGPDTLRHLRKLDRQSNIANYPHLNFPNLYLLDGGYKGFFEYSKKHCEPQQYVTMRDDRYKDQMMQGLKGLKSKNWKYARSKSFNGVTEDYEQIEVDG